MCNEIPIFPVLDYQCDAAIIQWMEDLESQLTALLWHQVCVRKRDDWLEVFFPGYVLVNDIKYVYDLQEKFVHIYSVTTASFS